jgi:Tfp pilus assembly protein PilO
MNRLSKEKRNQLLLVAIIVLAAVAGLWFSLIRSQQDDLRTLALKKKEDQGKLSQIAETIKNSKKAETELVTVSNQLVYAERDMPYGDLNVSMINTIRGFMKDQYAVKISNFAPTGGDAPVTALPKFPYRQVTMSISGIAFYHDLGKFVADFENRFPTSRIMNLDLSPSSAATLEDKEKLNFQMDIISLVGTRPAANP